MAKRKKTKSKTRCRRVGGAGLNAGNPIVTLVAVGAGYFLGDKINAPIEKALGDKIDGKIVGAAEAGIGAMLVFGKMGKKTLPKVIIGGMLAGAGAKKLMGEFGIGSIGGPYGNVKTMAGPRRVTGPYGNMKVVGAPGYTPNHQLGGYAGYTPNSGLNGSRMMAGAGMY